MKYLGTTVERDIKRSMFDYGPKEYEELNESVAIIDTEATEFELLHTRIADVLNQFNVESSTWGLKAYEFDVGVTTNPNKPIDQRKSVVVSKLRGAGVTTRELIENVSEAYANADVEVVEDNPNYNVIVKFVGVLGIPPNMDDLERSLREIIPAHMIYTLVFLYVTYDMLLGKYADYDALSSTGFTYEEILVN
ncbi:putative phage tail protein [Psychrobacillus sp. FSL K6-2365]|uniref:putative phage tail protein n=1 Tax=Psychrobacillus sp. FSL K6-2365 TaxID=2921546 RepID=UPI0030F70B21